MFRYKIVSTMVFSMLLSNSLVTLAASFDKGFRAYHSRDYETAFIEWIQLAGQGHPDAQYNLGVMYHIGKGVTRDYKKVVKWYTKAAEHGHAAAQLNLGIMYQHGDGVLKNDKVAVKWYTKVAGQGNAMAQTNLGFMHENGEGVLIDHLRAYMWYNLGAVNGDELGAKNKIKIAKKITSTQIAKAQEMSRRCLGSGYTDC